MRAACSCHAPRRVLDAVPRSVDPALGRRPDRARHGSELGARHPLRLRRQPARRALPAGRRGKGRVMKGSTSNRLRKAGFALGAGLVLALAGATLATIGTASGATSAPSAVQPSDATVAEIGR